MTDELATLQARCQALEAERDSARTSYETMYENCKVNVQKRGELEAQLSALQAVLAEIEQEMREWCDPDGYVVDGDDELAMVTRWADRLAGLRGIRQTEDRTAEKTDHAR